MVDTGKPYPKITRAMAARSHTALQKRIACRDLVIVASFKFGCSVRLLAEAFKMDPAEIRHVIERFESSVGTPPS